MDFYTDGSSFRKKNGNHAFIGVIGNQIVVANRFESKKTCNNQEELKAVIEVLKYIKKNNIKNSTIFTDSMYVVRSITGNRIAFQELWNEFFKYYDEKNVKIQWIKGHSDHTFNKKVDIFTRTGKLI